MEYYAVVFKGESLSHHGIKGMRWGYRRYQNEDGTLTEAGRKRYGTLKKGSSVYRVSLSPGDPTYDNKKYVSLTRSDHRKWQDHLGNGYAKYGKDTYDLKYKATKDLNIADWDSVNKIFMNETEERRNKIIQDSLDALKFMSYNNGLDFSSALSINFAAQTQAGKDFAQALISQGYQGVQDKHGQNTARNPVIIFNPDENLKLVRSRKNSFSRIRTKS